MRAMLYAMLIVGLTASAYAQGFSIPTGVNKIKTQDQIDRDNERNKAYEDKLKTLPDQNVKTDPWGNMRGTGAAQSDQKQAGQKQAAPKQKSASQKQAEQKPKPAGAQ